MAGGARRAGRSLGARGNRPPVRRSTLASRTDGRRTPRARHGERGWREHRDREGGDRQWPLLAVTHSRGVRARSPERPGLRARAVVETTFRGVARREQIPQIARENPPAMRWASEMCRRSVRSTL
jgi:hypothetical protein